MNEHQAYFYYQSCQTPVGWLRAISDGVHLIYLDWNQIGWKDPDRPDDVSRETISQLTAYFAGRLTDFTIPLRPTGVTPARRHWLDVMANITFDTTQLYRICRAAGARKWHGRWYRLCRNPIPLFTLVTGWSEKWHN